MGATVGAIVGARVGENVGLRSTICGAVVVGVSDVMEIVAIDDVGPANVFRVPTKPF